jgi:hypothetical protein
MHPHNLDGIHLRDIRKKGGVEVKKIMKALSTWQPYASLLVYKIKKYETRSWATNYKGLIAIHAAKKSAKSVMNMLLPWVWQTIQHLLSPYYPKIEYPGNLPVGAVLGYGNLIACHLIDAEFIATLSEDEKLMGDYTLGRYAWEIVDVVMLDKPVPMAGKQGLWTIYDADEILKKGA